MNNDEVTSNLAYLVDDDLRLEVDVDRVIQAGVRRRNRRTVIGAALGTVGLVAGLLTVTSQFDGGVDTAAQSGWTTVDISAKGLLDTFNDNGISASGPSDVWAIGENYDHGVALHWNGKSTTYVALTMLEEPSDIAAVAPDDVWVVGGTPGKGESGSDKPARIAHWDGRQWQDVQIPGKPAGAREVSLRSVSAVSADDVWAVGYTGVPQFSPLVLRWDGRTWQTVDVPTGDNALVESVAARAADDVWITVVDLTADLRAVHKALHWDGTTWTVTPTRWDAGGKIHEIVNGPNEMWLSGENAEGESVLQRWDGRQWTDVPLPPLPNTWSVSDITADGRGGFIMAGSIGATPSTPGEDPVFWHWDGARWSDFPAPDDTDHVTAVGMVPGTGTLWITAEKIKSPAPLPTDEAGETLRTPPYVFLAFREIG